QFVVRAPARGRILRRVGSVGDLTGPAAPQPPLFFVPDQPPVVRAEVDQEFIGRLREGMFARVRDDIRPDSPTWTGRLERVGGWVARRRSILLDPGQINDVRTLECVVRIEESPAPLLIGQRVRVILTDGPEEPKTPSPSE